MLLGAELAPVGQDLLELGVAVGLLVEHRLEGHPQRLDDVLRQHRELRARDLVAEVQAGSIVGDLDARADFEYNGTSLNSLFAQRSNLLRPAFWRMLRDILRFNREAPALLAADGSEIALGDYLEQGGYTRNFVERYIIPMGAAIWSTDPLAMRGFPARFFVRFLHNHGMLSVNERPQWRVICGGSASYVEKLTAGFHDRIRINTPVQSVQRLPGGVRVKAARSEEHTSELQSH